MKTVNIDLDKVMPELINLCVDICGHGISHIDAVRIAELLEDSAVRGKWIPASTKPGVHAGKKCSECKARITYSEHFNGQHLYCHKCGARMLKE